MYGSLLREKFSKVFCNIVLYLLLSKSVMSRITPDVVVKILRPYEN